MKNKSFLAIAIFFCTSAFSQQTRIYSDPPLIDKFKEAKEYFQKEEYSLAYPLFRELQRSVQESDRANNMITTQEIEYYTIVCGLKQNEGMAEQQAIEYINLEKNAARTQMLSFHLGEYYFRRQKFA